MREQREPTVDKKGKETSSRRTKRRTGMFRKKRNHRRVPTAQRVRTFYRLFSRLLRWIKPILVVSFLFAVGTFVWFHFSNSEPFQLKKVSIQSNLPVPTKQIMEVAGIKYGDNVFTMDLHRVAQRLHRYPRVRHFTLKRRLPDTIQFTLKLHKPTAVVMLEKPYLLNAEGRPYARVLNKKETKGLLKLTGFQRSDYQSQPDKMRTLFRQALALSRLYQSNKLTRYQDVKEIQYDPILGYILHANHSRIYLGTDRFPERMKRLKQVYQLLWQRGVRKIHYVYLNNQRHPRRAIIRMVDAVPVIETSDEVSGRKKL